ncbi:MAG: TAXI family TRAP transporter solute-binding subunit [Beijerinckiaceae bacterium]
MRRTVWTIVASALAIISIAGLAFYYFGRPNLIRIAVPRDSTDHRILSAASKFLLRDRSGVRFKLVLETDPAAAARALETGGADMAIARTDLGLPLNGKAVAIMRKDEALIVAPPGSKIASVADLRSKRIGIVTGSGFGANDQHLLAIILAQYELSTDDVTIIPVTMPQVGPAVAAAKVDAVFTVGVAPSDRLLEIVTAVTGSNRGEPVFVSISQAYAIAQSSPALTAGKIVAGAFGGAKPRPLSGIDTVAATTVLMADSQLPDVTVSAIARAMFALKSKISSSIPSALKIEAPSTSKDAALPVHPGAAAFLDGEDVSLLVKYSDFIYLGAMVASMIGSAFAALVGRANMYHRRRFDELINRLIELLAQVRAADNASMLKLAQIEVDGILAEAIRENGGKSIDSDLIGSLGLAIGQVREAIRDKGTELEKQAAVGSSSPQPAKISNPKPRQLATGRTRVRAVS